MQKYIFSKKLSIFFSYSFTSAYFSTKEIVLANREVHIEEGWKAALSGEFDKAYFDNIRAALKRGQVEGKSTYPPNSLIFNAFNKTPFDKVKVVILGQDPYHQPGQAMGLSFSVPPSVNIPASLRNIYLELKRDLGINPPSHGDLSTWAEQGVFLLNAILTVEAGQAASHKSIGWEHFTDKVISVLNEQKSGLIFLLWGNFAKSKKALIDETKHYVLEAVHPSPLAGGKFIGCGHFSKVNELLIKKAELPIDWSIK